LIVSLIIVVLMFSLLLVRQQAQAPSRADFSSHLQIIVNNTDTYFYNQFLDGAKQAADSMQVFIEIVPLEQGNPKSLKETVEKGIYAKVDGIALQAGFDTDIESLYDLAQRHSVQLALYESADASALPIPNITTNAYTIGTTAARLAIEASNGNCRAVVVLDQTDGIISDHPSMKIQGIIDYFSEYPLATLVETYVVNSDFLTTEQLMDDLFGQEQLTFNSIICLRETSTPMFAQRILDSNIISLVRLVGYGARPETLDYIDRYIIYGTVCPDAREIGFQTVVELVNSLNGRYTGDYSSVNLYSITKQNVSEFILTQEEDIG